MKRKSFLLAALALALLCAGPTWAHSITYETQAGPLFSFSMPATWSFRIDGKRIVAAPGDHSRWFGAWELEKVDFPKDATGAVEAYLEAFFQDVKVGPPTEVKVNGMPARRLDGGGLYSGNRVRFSVILFEPRPRTVCVALGVWDDEDVAREEAIESILGSLRPAHETAGR